MATAVSVKRWMVFCAAFAALPVCGAAGVLVVAEFVMIVHTVFAAMSAVPAVKVTKASA